MEKKQIYAKSNTFRHKLSVLKENFKNSAEIQAFLGIVFEVLALGFFGGMSLLLLLDVHILIKFLSMGCFLWLFKEKLYPLIVGILSSFTLVHNYR
jgi:hypothetical protein